MQGKKSKEATAFTRRNFVTGAAACSGAAAIGAVSRVAMADEALPADFVRAVEWDAEYDVVVVGYGAAGANASIAAADAGAKVLLIDKAMRGLHGGNSRYCGQGICGPQNGVEQFADYLKGLRGYFSTPSDAVIDAFAEQGGKLEDWLTYLGVDLSQVLIEPSAGEFKEWPAGGGDNAEVGPTVTYRCSMATFDGAYYKVLTDNVEARADAIDVWYACPARHLIQDPDSRVIHGVQVERDGHMYNVRAKSGVIMALGGYENNAQMLQDYLLMPNMVPYGACYNTGDGIVMAQEIGAKLWHMGNQAGPLWRFKSPDCEHGITSLMSAAGSILVGPSGERFMKEGGMNRHGHVSFGGHYEPQPTPYPTYAIMDNAYITSKKVYSIFSEGNQEEIEAGYFLIADTLEELAQKIYDSMPDHARLPNYTEAMGDYTSRFVATVEKWNASVEAGVDEQFGRAAKGMTAIAEPPFYALPQSIMMFNTQGGPERDELGRVIDLEGNPIPHLYSAGEFGAIWPDIYNGGCNLAECTYFGIIAGNNAAVAPNDAVLDELVSQPVNLTEAPEADPELGENQYLGVGYGIGGAVKVVCTIADGVVQDIQVVSNFETPGIGTKAIETIPGRLVEAAGEPIDARSGATVTSRAIGTAVMDCMQQAGMDVSQHLIATEMGSSKKANEQLNGPAAEGSKK